MKTFLYQNTNAAGLLHNEETATAIAGMGEIQRLYETFGHDRS
jgi:hypothetical protein